MLLACVSTGLLAQAKSGALGVYSFLGDGVDVTSADEAPRDTRIERTSRETLDFKNIGFDLIALREARAALLQQHPEARVMLYRAPAALTSDEQRKLADEAIRAKLPAWMVKTINEGKMTHLVIVTRNRGAMSARTGDGNSIGRGQVDGIGFYLDTIYTMRNRETGALSPGLLAPYTHIKVQLMDAMSGDMVATYDIRDAIAYGSNDQQVKADPWNFMPIEEKVKVLRDMVEKGMKRAMPELLGKR
ncbi:MAG: hypothetical protein RL227_2445 [Pseudomonadota bacterium]